METYVHRCQHIILMLLLYCLMGARTTNLGEALIEQLGFLHVTHLSGGIMSWTADGYETIAYKP